MLITLDCNRNWVYALSRSRFNRRNYIGVSMLKLCFGYPTPRGFFGYTLLNMYSVKYDGTLLTYVGNTGGCVTGEWATAVAVCEMLRRQAAAGTSLYDYCSMLGRSVYPGSVLASHDTPSEWTSQPVLDERLWRATSATGTTTAGAYSQPVELADSEVLL